MTEWDIVNEGFAIARDHLNSNRATPVSLGFRSRLKDKVSIRFCVMDPLTSEQESLHQNISAHLTNLCRRTQFLSRLAKENDWPPAFAQKVVEEYGKFLFIAKVAEHEVSPSPIIDKAWHLHLLHTEAYWYDLCPNILQMALQHAPHTGNKEDDVKFAGWTQNTLNSYRRFFGTPSLLWTAPDRTSYRTGLRIAAYIIGGISLGSLTGLIFAPDLWPLILLITVGSSIPAIILFIGAKSPLGPTGSSSSCGGGGGTCSTGSDGGHAHSCGGHSCGGGHGCGGGGSH